MMNCPICHRTCLEPNNNGILKCYCGQETSYTNPDQNLTFLCQIDFQTQTINFYCIFDIEKSGLTFRGYSLKKPNDNISWVISSLTKDAQMETLAEGGSEFLSPEEGWLLFQRFLNLKAFL